MDKPESVELFYQDGSSDKVYKASLEAKGKGWLVNYQHGRRGSALVSGTKTATPIIYSKAQMVYYKLVKSKTNKGYKTSTGTVPFQ